jgi:hypothetical protein
MNSASFFFYLATSDFSIDVSFNYLIGHINIISLPIPFPCNGFSYTVPLKPTNNIK